jgi:ABC-type amino acid transport substrate-binding protein
MELARPENMNNVLKTLVLLLALAGSAIGCAEPAPTINVGIYYPQVPPYMYKSDTTNTVRGVIPELLNQFFSANHIQVNYIEDNRQRAELKLYDGEIGMMVLAEKWSKHPEKALYSSAVITHRDFIYTMQPQKLQALDALKNSTICLRRHYVYTGLQEALNSGRLLRLDSDSEFDQMNMLVNGRCDFAYLNEHVAQWLKLHQFADAELYRSDYVVDETGMTLALSLQWQSLLPELNAFLQQAKESGLTETLLQQHINGANR